VPKIFFCATRLVPAPKVHRASKEKNVFCATRRVHAPRVHSESTIFCFALRALCPRLRFTRESKETKYFALRAPFSSLCSGLSVRLRFAMKARKIFLVGMR
jgi:hypothetical protein